jgi:hypothetical protein
MCRSPLELFKNSIYVKIQIYIDIYFNIVFNVA